MQSQEQVQQQGLELEQLELQQGQGLHQELVLQQGLGLQLELPRQLGPLLGPVLGQQVQRAHQLQLFQLQQEHLCLLTCLLFIALANMFAG